MRGSPEPGADLISRGQLFVVHIWQRAAAVPPPPRPACVTFQECWQRLPHLERVSGGSRRPLRRLSRTRGGAPPGFPGSSLLWLLAEAPGQARGWTTDRKGQQDLAFSPWSWGTSGTSCLARMVERGKVEPGGI